MMCTCKTDIENKMLEQTYKGKRVTDAELVSGGIIFGKSGSGFITSSDFEIKVEGYKKPQTQKVLHRFCPFCGVETERK